MTRWTQRTRAKRGFTMVELLVVIIIIAVLVAIALPRYFAAIYAGRVRACQSNFKIINTAAQAYFAQNKAWPTLVTDMVQGTAATTPVGMKGAQLTELPICPFDTTADGSAIPYLLTPVYETPGDATSPQIGVETAETGHFDATTGPWQTAIKHVAPPAP
jgi:prepilin-type N-terminal cleavage/methylation domain-containing protein